ncbi:HAMP domain-containing protein [Actinomadura sp. KC216]|uniref:sensor histidine kinase n=1 Tax=Actinomadura sp. KC216 TaxID=2530370 RepID=UPI0010448261|nr:nitrate- and nitrite sensing domain-containing protein [Actinomadura sp. KC216]TDB88609.1 HAMP domain-containing protein [Actinomadura sp. KC216]
MGKSEAAGTLRGRRRTYPIWRRIALLLAVPLTALFVQWGIPASVTVSNALQRFDFSTVYNNVAVPATQVTETLQEERAAAVQFLFRFKIADRQRFGDLVAKTDAAVAAFRKQALSSDTRGAMDDTMETRVRKLSDAYNHLITLRERVGIGGTTPLGAIEGYSQVADITIRLLTTLVSIDDRTVYLHTTALLHNFWAREFMLREHALLSSLPEGQMSASNRAAFAAWSEARIQYFELGRAQSSGEIEQIMYDLANSGEFTAYTTLENNVVNNGIVPDPAEWRAAIDALRPAWARDAAKAESVVNNTDVKPAGRRIMLQFFVIGVVGLLGVVASVILSLLFARRLSAELRELQESAQRLANERLPRVVARLRRGEQVDVEAESPAPVTGRTKEVALVGEAFGTVQRTAVATAVAESDLRASINRVFINLSWRSQSLLHRQLRLLDQMERRAAGPEELDDLFRLDHLTTRMRRHAEGLVILAGSPTVRAWDHPVAAEDVVRAAVAEIEDYTRVELSGTAAVAVTGDVVADIIHLLAELIENAAVFSPPTTEVTVKIETVANGLAVEIIDRGIGLHPDELDQLNLRLEGGGEFDLIDTERLGLFVVARLAARHGVKVSLQPSAYGGTTAVVLIPHALVTLDDDLARGSIPGTARTMVAAMATADGRQRLGRPARPAIPAPIARPQPDDMLEDPQDGPPSGAPPIVTSPSPTLDQPAPWFDDNPAPYEEPAPQYDAQYDTPAYDTPAYDTPQYERTPSLDPPAVAFEQHAVAFDQTGASDPYDSYGSHGNRPRPPAGDDQPVEAESSEVTGRLPRRVRQRSLAPQLRRGPAPERAEPAEVAAPDDDFDEPSPELSRALMSSLQSGWLRGRVMDDEPEEPGPRDEWGER